MANILVRFREVTGQVVVSRLGVIDVVAAEPVFKRVPVPWDAKRHFFCSFKTVAYFVRHVRQAYDAAEFALFQ